MCKFQNLNFYSQEEHLIRNRSVIIVREICYTNGIFKKCVYLNVVISFIIDVCKVQTLNVSYALMNSIKYVKI